MKNLISIADTIPEERWETLNRKPKYKVKTKERDRPENVKQRIVKERGFKNIRTVSEHVAEFDYRPTKCKRPIVWWHYVKTLLWKKET